MEKLDFKRYTFIIGNFGSGKTEIAINLALRHAAMGSSMLIDMDIINPYFKSSSKEKILRDAGVEIAMTPDDIGEALVRILTKRGIYERCVIS